MLVGRVKRKMMQITRRRNTFPPLSLLPLPCSAACENGISSAAVMEQVGGGEGVGAGQLFLSFAVKSCLNFSGLPKLDSRKLKARDFLIVFLGLRADKLMLLLPATA